MQPAAGGQDTLKRPARLPPTVAALKRPAAISPFPAELPSPDGFPFLLPFSRGFFPGSFWGCWEHCPLCESRRSLTGSGSDGRAGEVSSGRAGFVAVTPRLALSQSPASRASLPPSKTGFPSDPARFPHYLFLLFRSFALFSFSSFLKLTRGGGPARLRGLRGAEAAGRLPRPRCRLPGGGCWRGVPGGRRRRRSRGRSPPAPSEAGRC